MNRPLHDQLARTLLDCHVKVTTAVPGHGVNECFGAVRDLEDPPATWSFHEEVAFGMAHGASLAGGRAICMMKAHGFLKASNGISDALYAGTRAGLVMIVFDDPTGKHSDSVLDIGPAAKALDIPTRRVQRAEEMAPVLRDALGASERDQLPRLLILPAAEADTSVPAGDGSLDPPDITDPLEPDRRVCGPLFAPYQRSVLEAKRNGKDWRTLERPTLPRIPDELPASYRDQAREYIPWFKAFRERRPPFVSGDTSIPTLFCLPPYRAVDVCTYLGGSLPLALGALMSGEPGAWAITGDFAFLAAGHLGLLEARQRSLPLNVVVFHNGRAEATGGQPIPEGLLDRVLSGYQEHLHVLETPRDTEACDRELSRMEESDQMDILVLQYD